MSLLCFFKNSLTNPCFPIQDDKIRLAQVQTLHKIAHKGWLSVQNPVLKSIDLFLSFSQQDIVSSAAIFIEKGSLIEPSHLVFGREIFCTVACVGEIILANQVPPKHILCMLHQILSRVYQVAGHKLILI